MILFIHIELTRELSIVKSIVMKRKAINPSTLFDSTQFGFSQIVVSNPGKIVSISGQVAWDKHQNIIGENDLAMQTEKALDNLKIAVTEAGGSMDDIVMLRIYKVNFQKEDANVISEILQKYFGVENPPASTWLSVQGLANDKFMIEIEAQAMF